MTTAAGAASSGARRTARQLRRTSPLATTPDIASTGAAVLTAGDTEAGAAGGYARELA